MEKDFGGVFVGLCMIKNIKIKETPIEHFERTEGEAGYKINKLIGIIIKNAIGLLKNKI